MYVYMYKHNAHYLFLSQVWAACSLLDYEIQGTAPLLQVSGTKHWQRHQPKLYTGNYSSATTISQTPFLTVTLRLDQVKATLPEII